MIKLNKNFLLASVFAVAMGSFTSTAYAKEFATTNGAAAAVKGTETAEVKYEVLLKSGDPDQKVAAIKEVRAFAGLGLKEAKDIVDGAKGDNPVSIKKDVNKKEAEDFKAAMAKIGAFVELKEMSAGAAGAGAGAGAAGAAAGAAAGDTKMNKEMDALKKKMDLAKTPAEKQAIEGKMAELAKKGGMPGANQSGSGAGNGGMMPLEGAAGGAGAGAAVEGKPCAADGCTGPECTWQKPAAVPAAAEAAAAPAGAAAKPTAEEIMALKRAMEDLQEEGGDAYKAAKKAYDDAMAQSTK